MTLHIPEMPTRPPVESRGGRLRIGIDVGGTKIHVVALTEGSVPIGERRIETGAGSDVPDALPQILRELLDALSLGGSDIQSIGVGIPGIVPPRGETVGHAVNLGVSSVALSVTAPLTAAFPRVAVRLMNDVNAAAVGVHATLYPQVSNMVYLSIGTGLAAGVIVDGHLAAGTSGGAGEVGHFPIEPRRFQCACGQFGCVETISSGGGLKSRLPNEGPRVASRLFDGAVISDDLVLAREDFLVGIAATVRLLILAHDPEVIVIGGGVANVGSPLLDSIATRLRMEASVSPFLEAMRIPQRLRLIPPHSSVAAVGAAYIGQEV